MSVSTPFARSEPRSSTLRRPAELLRMLCLAAMASGLLARSACADDARVPIRIPEEFRVAKAAAAQAAPAGVDGAAYQAIIAPTFTGSDGNISFVRIGNFGPAATTVNVTVVGSPSGNVYGSGNLQIPTSASPQFSLQQILAAAGAGALTGGDVSYSLYLKDPDQGLSFQHVIYNNANGFFENAGICRFDAGADYSGFNARVLNVHTSLLASYPAQISVHNYGATAATYNASVYDAASGSLIGTVPVPVAANATYFAPFTWYQQQVNWTPTGNQLHANIVFTTTGSSPFAAIVGQYIFNQPLSAYVNMTQRCGL